MPIRQALSRLLRAARALAFGRPRAPQPRAFAPAASLARTTEWLAALARVLAGDSYFLLPISFPRFPGRFPSLTAKLRAEIGLPALPPRTDAQRATARLHYMRRVFATQSTACIATRLARRLNLTQADAAWPTDLIAITVPPAQLARTAPPARRPGRRPRPRPLPFPTLPKIPEFRLPTQRRVPQRE